MLGVGIGDEVITTAYSWISSSETISQTGAKPVFVDIDEYFTIDVAKLEAHITPQTKAQFQFTFMVKCNMEAIRNCKPT
jgi:dTDP-4-amino-4,6-dideoxygalactose transaminase